MPEERRGNVVIDFSFAHKNILPKTFNGGARIMKSPGVEKKKPNDKK